MKYVYIYGDFLVSIFIHPKTIISNIIGLQHWTLHVVEITQFFKHEGVLYWFSNFQYPSYYLMFHLVLTKYFLVFGMKYLIFHSFYFLVLISKFASIHKKERCLDLVTDWSCNCNGFNSRSSFKIDTLNPHLTLNLELERTKIQ